MQWQALKSGRPIPTVRPPVVRPDRGFASTAVWALVAIGAVATGTVVGGVWAQGQIDGPDEPLAAKVTVNDNATILPQPSEASSPKKPKGASTGNLVLASQLTRTALLLPTSDDLPRSSLNLWDLPEAAPGATPSLWLALERLRE